MERKLPNSIIISSKPGQLGNMLFLFAHVIALARDKNIKVKAPAFIKYADYFNSTCNSLIPSYPPTPSSIKSNLLRKTIFQLISFFSRTIVNLKLNNRLFSVIALDQNELFNLEDETNVEKYNCRYLFIHGWLFRSKELLQKHKNNIIDFFEPSDTYKMNINRLVTGDNEMLIGIHIRHGDYKNFQGGKYYYTLSQYKNIMQKALALFPHKKIIFLICSNTQEDIAIFDGMNLKLGTNHELEDLYSFTKCNYLIGPPSTYSIWASFYGDVPLYQVHDPELPFTLEDFRIVVS